MTDKRKQFDPTKGDPAQYPLATDRIIALERVSATLSVATLAFLQAERDLKYATIPTDNPLTKAMDELSLSMAKVVALNTSLLTRLKR